MTVVERAQPVHLDGYQLRLPVYEGPLDVLLRLVERDQLAITDVSLVAVTDQFLAYIASLIDVPPSLLADFTAIGARLVAMKCRSLLPAPPREDDQVDPGDLTRQLQAYQAVKSLAEQLREREQSGLRSWTRESPVPGDLPAGERLVRVPLVSLVRALHRCLNRVPVEPQRFSPRPIVTLASMTRRILSRLGSRRLRYSALVGESADRAELAVGFIALLSLLRSRLVNASQPVLFGEIEIERCRQPQLEATDD